MRSPAKESFRRDTARVRGGDNDFVVAATLDIDALRAFQSRAKRWPEEGDKFKPVPEGFQLGGSCRRLPPAWLIGLSSASIFWRKISSVILHS